MASNREIFYREVIPNPDVVELKEIGHSPLLESPFEMLEHYFDFVNKTE